MLENYIFVNFGSLITIHLFSRSNVVVYSISKELKR